MVTVIFIALAGFFLWTTFRFLAPVRVPDRLALLLYGGSAYGLTYLPRDVLEALSGAGLLVLVTVLSRIEPPQAWDWRAGWEMVRPARRRKPESIPQVGRRIPRLLSGEGLTALPPVL